MSKLTLIFPHQLYWPHPALTRERTALLIEHPLFFGDWQYPLKFHKLKLMLHRASMQRYAARLRQAGYTTVYLEYEQVKNQGELDAALLEMDASELHVVDPTDHWLEQRLKKMAEEHRQKLIWYESPNFLTPKSKILEYLSDKKSYFHHHFYQWQRKRMQILIEADGTPTGGKWSFDAENREALPKDIEVPDLPQRNTADSRNALDEARAYVEKQFPDNPGSTEWPGYPLTHDEAQQWWQQFLEERFSKFGPYEDAIASNQTFLFHSVLTPALNIGLLDPKLLVEETLKYAGSHEVPLNSLEGFVRQLIGWREFIRGVYLVAGSTQRTSNALKHTRRLTSHWYDGTTGLDPLDATIKQVLKTGYTHHIERLMIVGSVMLMSELHPDEAYRWFMELYIDAYDWVMVPNVYGMSQFADGGLMVTKPYSSGSRYILKMSDFPRGAWCDTWDGLYWNFVDQHQELLKNQARMGVIVANWERQSEEKRQKHMQNAQSLIERITQS